MSRVNFRESKFKGMEIPVCNKGGVTLSGEKSQYNGTAKSDMKYTYKGKKS